MKKTIMEQPHTFIYRVKNIFPLAKDVSQIVLEPESASLTYEPGQYVNVVQSDEQFSPLSIANAPHTNGEIEFHLSHRPKNTKAADLLHQAQHKKIWQIAGPFGTKTGSILQPDKKIIFLAKGTGFAPIKSILEEKIGQNQFSCILFWSVPTTKDLYLLNIIEAWKQQCQKFIFVPLFTKEPSLSLFEAVLQIQNNFSNCQVYASGSLSFIDVAFNEFKKHGLKKEFFHSDMLL